MLCLTIIFEVHFIEIHPKNGSELVGIIELDSNPKKLHIRAISMIGSGGSTLFRRHSVLLV